MTGIKTHRAGRPVLALLAVAVLSLAGFAAPGSALAAAASPVSRAPGQTGQASSQGSHSTPARRACPAAKPGDAACLALVRTNVRGHVGMFTAGTAPTGYGPADLQSAYSLPSATAGAGQTVAVVDAYNDPHAAADLKIYRQQYGLPACTAASGCFRKVNEKGQQGPYPAADRNWAEEESLDIDMVSAICPRCRILLVEATSASLADLGQSVDTAIRLGAKYVSNSYGAVEYSGETAGDTYYDHPGVAITAAAGDSGYDNGSSDAPNYPAASEYVTSVGGTSLTRNPGSPRGWAEAAWSYGGSGCSLFEPRPPWQAGTGCAANHMTADVSAVADPSTGVAVYDTYSQSGWEVFGGTSVASPIIASVYALAGPPAAGSYPSSYPYADPSAFNDIINGSNGGSCTPASWCNAGPGYDGPTGLGTPDGVAGFFAGQRGTLTGTVTDAATRQPVAGATVEAGGLSVAAGSSGQYTLSVPAGTYTVTASDLGYATVTASHVRATPNRTVTKDFRLRTVPTVTVSGAITDGSGHRWPLLARVSVAGTTAAAYTDPATGEYSLSLPENSVHTLDVDPVYPGYQQAQQEVKTATADITQNISVPVDASTCTAPGYKYTYRGTTQTFNASTSLPTGWTAASRPAPAPGWAITAPSSSSPNYTGGTGNFAWSNHTAAAEASLYTPVTNLSNAAAPVLQFDGYYLGNNGDGTGGIYVDLSTDGGTTWRNIWEYASNTPMYGQRLTVPLPRAAGQSQVQIRFRYANRALAGGGGGWQLDNVFLGNRSCDPSISGGLVVGSVTDANTGQGIGGADVTSTSSPPVSGTTAQIPGDPAAGSGDYWLFSPQTGSQQFQATGYNYRPQTATARITANAVTPLNFSLAAGQLTAEPGSLSATQRLGVTKTTTVTLANTGTNPVSLNLGEQLGGFTTAGQNPASAQAAWTSLPDLPKPVSGNLAATDPATGDVYSVGGDNPSGTRDVATGYVYQPGASAWAPIPPMPAPDAYDVGAFVNGKLYVVGGDAQFYGAPVWIYDPVTRHWSDGARGPNGGVYASGVAVLDGSIYTVGGYNGHATNVEAYDPATNTWKAAASYPQAILYPACGGLDGELYCAGGLNFASSLTGPHAVIRDAYVYNPATNTWSAISPLPEDLTESSYTTANGQLLTAGGFTENLRLPIGGGRFSATSAAYSYTPGKGWATLPDLPVPTRAGGGGCGPGGFYVVGGQVKNHLTRSAEVLPGYSDCGGNGHDVPWLSVTPSSATLQPGQRVTVTVTMNAADPSVTGVTQPGTYTAQINVDSNTPYQLSVPVTMTVQPPKSWGEVTGTVTDASTGSPISGATVQICTLYDKTTGSCGPGSQTYTLTTSADGTYGLWLSHSGSPVQILATASGYKPESQTAKITAGKTTTASFALSRT